MIWEKTIIDPGRFSAKKERTLPQFPEEYNAAALPLGDICRGRVILYAVHYFYPKKRGGTERFTLNIARAARDAGNRPVVLVLEANEPKSLYSEQCGGILYRYYEYEGISCIGFRHLKAPLGLYYKDVRLDDGDLREFARLILEKEGVDLVHATYPQPFASFLSECSAAGVPYIVTCTDFALSCHYSTMVDKRGNFCPRSRHGERCKDICTTYGCRDFHNRWAAAEELLQSAVLVTVPSEFVARVLSNEFPRVKFLPVNHGISKEFTVLRKRFSVRRFVYAGTLSPLKGVHLLVRAFRRISREDISLCIYGEGDEKYEQKLRRAADSRIKFCGAACARDMPKIYSEADCVIVPSMWYETYNFVLREAASTGALIIAADIGAMSEAIDEGINGYLFRAGDEEDLYKKLLLACDFDFKNYKGKKLPSLSDEGNLYLGVYGAAINEKD